MSPEQALKIAASQWREIPTPEQIIAALDAAGFAIVSSDIERHLVDAVDDPVAFVRDILARRKISANKLAAKAGIAASTLNRALNNPSHTSILSSRTLLKIKSWDTEIGKSPAVSA